MVFGNRSARRAFIALAPAAFICFLATNALAKGASEDATTFQVNSSHDGNVVFAAGFSAPLAKAWTYDTGGTVTFPLIARGALYIVSSGDDVFALNLADGSKLWEHLLGENGNLGAYDDGMLFFNSGVQISALKAKNGKPAWSVAESASGSPVAGNSTAPIALKGTVYLTGSLNVTAYNEKTGAFKWSQLIIATSSQVAYGDGGIYAGGPSQYYKFDAVDGSLLWQNSGCCHGGGGIAVNYFKNRVYLVDWAEGNFALRSEDGTATGSFPGSTPPTFFSIGKRGFELVISNGKLFCQDVKTGNVVWSFSNKSLSGQPIVINGQPIVTAGNSIYMLDGATGSQLWTDDVGAQITSLNAGDGVLAVTTGSSVIVYKPQ